MNINKTFNSIKMSITLNKGTNLLSGDSGTGKTLLMQAVELYCLENNIKYTFLNYRNKDNSVEQILSLCDTSKFIIIDNADLFITASLLKHLQKIAEYILISLKDTTLIDENNITEYLVHYNNMELHLEEI